jgi:hypothetical protein
LEAQGFFINRPLPADEFRALLSSQAVRVQRPPQANKQLVG